MNPQNRQDFNDTSATGQSQDDIIVVTTWLLMLSYALVSNILIVYGILKNHAMRSATSYWFIISLAVCDLVMIIISLIHLVPATAFHDAFLNYNSSRNTNMLFVYNLFWYSGVLQLSLMAGNRFVSIVYPMEYKYLFSPHRSIMILIFMYFLGFLSSLPTLHECCHTLWDGHAYITKYENAETWYKYVDMTINSLSLIVMVFSYAVIIYKVRESGRAMAKYQLTIRTRLLFQQQAQQMNGSNGHDGVVRAASIRPPRSHVSKKEMRLFIQFFVVSVVFLITWATWQWMPLIFSSKWAHFAMTSLFFINNSINPTVYFLFNTQLRRELNYLFCRTHAISSQSHRKRTLGRNANQLNNQDNTHLANSVVASSTMSNANELSNSSSSSTDYTYKDHKRYLIQNGTTAAVTVNKSSSKHACKTNISLKTSKNAGKVVAQSMTTSASAHGLSVL